MEHNTAEYNTMEHNTTQQSTTQRNGAQHNRAKYIASMFALVDLSIMGLEICSGVNSLSLYFQKTVGQWQDAHSSKMSEICVWFLI